MTVIEAMDLPIGKVCRRKIIIRLGHRVGCPKVRNIMLQKFRRKNIQVRMHGSRGWKRRTERKKGNRKNMFEGVGNIV